MSFIAHIECMFAWFVRPYVNEETNTVTKNTTKVHTLKCSHSDVYILVKVCLCCINMLTHTNKKEHMHHNKVCMLIMYVYVS